MKRFVMLVLTLAIVLAGCGSSKVNTASIKGNKDTTETVSFADHVMAKCVSNVLALRNHAGRVQALACVKSSVPPAKREAFGACATKALETSGLSKRRIKTRLNGCYATAVGA